MWLLGFKDLEARYDNCVTAAAKYFDVSIQVFHYVYVQQF